MFHARKVRFLILCLLPLVLSAGCAHVISSEVRKEVRKDLSFTTVQRSPDSYVGQMVIWGGVILGTENQKEGTLIEVLQTPLDSYGYPDNDVYSEGRFLIKFPKYMDPEVYREGRKITLAGEILGKEVRPVGEADYTYPIIAPREVHLWKRYPYAYYPEPYPYDDWYWDGYPGPVLLPYFGFYGHFGFHHHHH